MCRVVFESVTKIFRSRPVLFNWIGREQRADLFALRDISMTIESGAVLVILGPNGSGKTTLLKLISGMLLPDSGTVLVGDADMRSQHRQTRSNVGFAVASERSFFPRLTAHENLDFFGALENVPRSLRKQRIQFVLAATDLLEASDKLVMKFSIGMYQKLGIARALLKEPSVLLLDEATRSLDPGTTTRLWCMIREAAARGTTVVLSTHRFDEALAVGDAVAVLQRGTLVANKRLTENGSADQLREFYFRSLGGSEPTLELAGRDIL